MEPLELGDCLKSDRRDSQVASKAVGSRAACDVAQIVVHMPIWYLILQSHDPALPRCGGVVIKMCGPMAHFNLCG